MNYIGNVLAWLSETWIVWLAFTLGVIGGYIGGWFLWGRRIYRMQDGKPEVCVRGH